MKQIRLLMTLVITAFMLLAVPARAAEDGCWRLDWVNQDTVNIEVIDVIIDDEGGVMLLSPNQMVKDVSVEYLIWDEELIAIEVWAGELSPAQALSLHVYLYDVMPALRVTCVNEQGQKERWYITDSGEDGSLILVCGDFAETEWIHF